MKMTAIRANSNSGLTMDQMMSVAPSIFAEAPHESRSERYCAVSTIDVINTLMGEGFVPHYASQARVTQKGLMQGKQNYTRHMVRLRHPDMNRNVEQSPEVIIVNSHDGSSSYQMAHGAFRFVCMNGLFLGDLTDNIRVLHKGNRQGIMDDVLNGAFRIVSEGREKMEIAQAMRETAMPLDERLELARQGNIARFDDEGKVRLDDILRPRRREDMSNDYWTTFNRVQEATMKGGYETRNAQGVRGRRARALSNIMAEMSVNTHIWTAAHNMFQQNQMTVNRPNFILID